MTKKRRNNGRNKHGRGHVKRVRCETSAAMVPKDKAIKRFLVKNMVDASALRDLADACPIEGYALPKMYRKVYYSVSAAIHSRIVRVRSAKNRKNREPPARPFFRGGMRGGPGGGGAGGGGAGAQFGGGFAGGFAGFQRSDRPAPFGGAGAGARPPGAGGFDRGFGGGAGGGFGTAPPPAVPAGGAGAEVGKEDEWA